MRYQKKQTRQIVIFMCLLAYLLAGVGAGNGSIPSFLLMIGEESHTVFAAERYNHICFVFHHLGNKDEHELSAGGRGEHKHDDKVLADIAPGPVSPPDHDIDIPKQKPFISSSTKANEASKSLFSSVTVRTAPVFDNAASTGFPPDSFPKTNSAFASLRATVLLI